MRRDYPPPLTRQPNAHCTDFLDMPLTTGAHGGSLRIAHTEVGARPRRSKVRWRDERLSAVCRALTRCHRDGAREHVCLLLHRHLDLGARCVRPIEREEIMSAIRQLGVGAAFSSSSTGRRIGIATTMSSWSTKASRGIWRGSASRSGIGMSARWIGWQPTLRP